MFDIQLTCKWVNSFKILNFTVQGVTCVDGKADISSSPTKSRTLFIKLRKYCRMSHLKVTLFDENELRKIVSLVGDLRQTKLTPN